MYKRQIINSAKSIGNVKVITAVLENSGADTLRQISDKIRDKSADYISVLAGINDGKATLACSCGKDAVKSGAHAGNIVRETAKLADVYKRQAIRQIVRARAMMPILHVSVLSPRGQR